MARWRDGLFLSVCASTLRALDAGSIMLTLPSGRSQVIGRGRGVRADLTLHDLSVFRHALRRGSLGFAEAYMAGTVSTSDLGAMFRFFIDNREALGRAWQGQFKVRQRDRAYHRARPNTVAGSRDNIAAHYDLGNAFYAPWLDQSMTYSSALFERPDETLEAAQTRKLDRIIDELRLEPGMRVLEIGCGWGTLAKRMAERGVHVTAITISAEQFAFVRQHVAGAGLEQAVDVQLIDYRLVGGTFDRVVSVEMIEAVGEEHWSDYFNVIARRLKPGGLAILQAITIDERQFAGYRAKADFIQRYIFPGGMLPTETAMEQVAVQAQLAYRPMLRFGQSYALTLAEWRRRFDAAWPKISGLGFDERFYRMWIYYLTYCEVGFEKGSIDVGLYRFDRA